MKRIRFNNFRDFRTGKLLEYELTDTEYLEYKKDNNIEERKSWGYIIRKLLKFKS